jgi:hypothetical protein
MKDWMKTVIVGFIAGALSVVIFHQGGFWLLKQLGLSGGTQWSMRPVPPWAVPLIVSQAFWAGLWGIVGAFLVERLPGYFKSWPGWVLFAALLPTLVNWFVVAPLKGAPLGFGFRAPGVYIVVGVYAFWGFGMWLIVRALRKAFNWP